MQENRVISMKCRSCQQDVTHTFLDLGTSPPSNAYLTADELNQADVYFPLKVRVCHHCWLVQAEEHADHRQIFDKNYAYFSSYSSSWLQHAKQYTDMVCEKLTLNESSLVYEIAANDGYLLQYFRQANIPCIGIEPTHSTAEAAREKHIDIIEDFFSERLARGLVETHGQADLIIGNNVYAHVPDINDFTLGIEHLLSHHGVVTLEFPHLLELVKNNQFDTVYHEHFSYLSLTAVDAIFTKNGLTIIDIDTLPTHGGSIRVYGKKSSTSNTVHSNVKEMLQREKDEGINNVSFYDHFQSKADAIKQQVLSFLLTAKADGHTVLAYGAAAKGNTLLNYCGIKPDLLPCVIDASPHKQGKFMPGSRIPIVDEDTIKQVKPKYVWILPWNIKDEIKEQLSYIREWKGEFVTAIPSLSVK